MIKLPTKEAAIESTRAIEARISQQRLKESQLEQREKFTKELNPTICYNIHCPSHVVMVLGDIEPHCIYKNCFHKHNPYGFYN